MSRSDEAVFSRPLVTRLIEALEACPLPHLTPNEQAHLLVLIQTTLEVRRPVNNKVPLCGLVSYSFPDR
jgi:hypothetical protein